LKIALSFLLPILCFLLLSAAQTVDDWRELPNHMAGTWDLSGQVMGREAHHQVRAEWVLDRQFLTIHEETAPDAPKTEQRYEALWFLGYDSVSERYVLHLLDVFGSRFSETLGYGKRDGDQIEFVFEYPDGPFRTTYRWNPADNAWQWRMRQKDKEGRWTDFADLRLVRSKSH
jgi:hypothetical protein